MGEMHGNVGVKREFQRFMNRFFYNKEESEKNLSLMYYYLDDMIAYIEDIQATIGTKLIEKDFEECYLEEIDKRIWFDDELRVILIDAITDNEKKKLAAKRNIEVEKEQTNRAKGNH